jgi:hypothetical protein
MNKFVVTKEQIKVGLCVGLLIIGLGMGIYSLCVPPIGVIDNSVLTFMGELLAFAAAILGIDVVNKYKLFSKDSDKS